MRILLNLVTLTVLSIFGLLALGSERTDPNDLFDRQGTVAKYRGPFKLYVDNSPANVGNFWSLADSACELAKRYGDLTEVSVYVVVSKEGVVDKYGNERRDDLPAPDIVFDSQLLAEARKYAECELGFAMSSDVATLFNSKILLLRLKYPKLFDDQELIKIR